MPHVDPDDLAGLVIDRDLVPDDVATHVGQCDLCRELADELATTFALAHDAPALVPAPDAVRRNVLAAITQQDPAEPPSATGAAAPTARQSSDQVTSISSRRDRRVPWWTLAVAAGVALVLGVGLGRALIPGPDETSTEVLMAADLSALDGPQARGSAQAVSSQADDVLTIRVRARELGAEGLLEVWLINLDGKRMVSLGFLASGESGDFKVPARLMEEGYRIVDISSEPDDGNPTHSGVSLARGELA